MITAAPVAPGRIGEAIQPAILQAYLGELENWIRTRRVELDDLDQVDEAFHNTGVQGVTFPSRHGPYSPVMHDEPNFSGVKLDTEKLRPHDRT